MCNKQLPSLRVAINVVMQHTTYNGLVFAVHMSFTALGLFPLQLQLHSCISLQEFWPVSQAHHVCPQSRALWTPPLPPSMPWLSHKGPVRLLIPPYPTTVHHQAPTKIQTLQNDEATGNRTKMIPWKGTSMRLIKKKITYLELLELTCRADICNWWLWPSSKKWTVFKPHSLHCLQRLLQTGFGLSCQSGILCSSNKWCHLTMHHKLGW